MKNFNHISIVITGRNAVKYVDQCLESVLTQDYPDFEVIFIDALSNDGTYEAALKYGDKYSNIKFVQNTVRKFQGENIKLGVEMSLPNSIIITVDSDDMLSHDTVLHRVNMEYNKHNCWMTFGTYSEINPTRDVSSHYHDYPVEVKQNRTFRNYKWLASHLRTFKRELFLKIKEQDLIDPTTGNYFETACDISFQFPMLEMAGLKSRYIPDILYIYNKGNPESDFLKSKEIEERIVGYIKSLPAYETITEL